MSKNVLIDNLSVPLNGISAVRYDIQAGDGNLMIDGMLASEQLLASGTLDYLETQQTPIINLVSNNGVAAFTIQEGKNKQLRFRMPWSACNRATNWIIHLNPRISCKITAHSNGGNLELDLHEINLTGLSVDTGGGNITLVLPKVSDDMSVFARTGAGNVEMSIPQGIAVRIQARTRLGKLNMDPHFELIDKAIYQSPGYETASEKVEITASSGAGNVSVTFR